MFINPYKLQQMEVTFSESLIPQPEVVLRHCWTDRMQNYEQALREEMQVKLSPQEFLDWEKAWEMG